jgi:uncharacterized protein YabE (DUF348 family)/3D (Asp-Asp-Asp) domain-containing protein
LTYWLQGAPARPAARQQLRHLDPAQIHLLSNTRSRLRFALIATIALIAVLAFVIFPPQRLSVSADGQQINVVSRQDDIVGLLDSAGISRDPGDVLVKSQSYIAVERAVPVLVSVDGRLLSWRSRQATVGKVLDEMGIHVTPYDTVALAGEEVALSQPMPVAPTASALAALPGQSASAPPALDIQVKRAVPLTLNEDGLAISLQSSRATISEVLRDAGVQLGPADLIFPPPATTVTAGMHIEISHADEITLRIGGSSRTVYTHQTTLEAALAEAGLNFGPDDRVEPPLSVAVANGMQARVVRVSGREIEEREDVEHVTVFRPDESLTGTQTRRVVGKDGVRVDVFKIVIEDGVEIEKTYERVYYDPEPVDTVIYYSPSSLESTGIDPSNLKVASTARMYATWYNAASSGKPATSSSYGITASGVPVTKGIVAVDPAVIPLGTRLYIPGYGFAVAGDTGGGIKGNMIDLGFPDGVAVDWNTGWTDVFILSQ